MPVKYGEKSSRVSSLLPQKNMTGILMEIPCNFSSQIDCSLVEIHTKFHDYSMSFLQVLFVFHAGISIRFGSIFDQTTVKSTWENLSYFLQGAISLLVFVVL